MIDTVQELIDRLKLGEDSLVEFKEVKFSREKVAEPHAESLAGEICAFVNMAGGVVLVGVADNGTVQGIPQDKLSVVENYISNACGNNCRPPVLRNTIALENMADRPFTRKQLLVSFLSRQVRPHTGRYCIEARGEGIHLILERSEAVSGNRPEYRLIGDELLLTVWAAPPPFADNTNPINLQESAT